VFHNNLLAHVDDGACDGAVRSSRWAGTCTFPAEGAEGECSSFTLSTNIVVASDANLFFLSIPDALDNMTMVSNDYWSATAGPNMTFPHGQTFPEWVASGKDADSCVADPQQVQPLGPQFWLLKPTSPAIARGFVPIDVSQVGPLRPVGPNSLHVSPAQLPDAIAESVFLH
jgi:hypothetical protein